MRASQSNAGGPWLGYVEALAAATLWASSGIFAVHLFGMGVPPETLAVLRPLVGAILLLAVALIRGPKTLRIDITGLAILGIGGGVAIGVFQFAYQFSTDAVGVPTTVALLYLAPAIVVAVSGPLLKEWPTRTRLSLVGVTLAGVWLSVAGAEEVTATFGTAGLAWGVLAGVSYAMYTVFGRWATPRYGVLPTVVYSTLGACAMLIVTIPLAPGSHALPPTPAAWGLVILFGALTIALAQFLFFDALGRIEASRASLATAVEPAVAAVLSTLLLAQGLRPMGRIGVGPVVAGVAGVGVTARADPRT